MSNRTYRVVLTDEFGHKAEAMFEDERSTRTAMETLRAVLAEASLDPRGFDGVSPTFKGAELRQFLVQYDREDIGWGVYVNIFPKTTDRNLHHEFISMV